jgi:hypothetical protein
MLLLYAAFTVYVGHRRRKRAGAKMAAESVVSASATNPIFQDPAFTGGGPRDSESASEQPARPEQVFHAAAAAQQKVQL